MNAVPGSSGDWPMGSLASIEEIWVDAARTKDPLAIMAGSTSWLLPEDEDDDYYDDTGWPPDAGAADDHLVESNSVSEVFYPWSAIRCDTGCYDGGRLFAKKSGLPVYGHKLRAYNQGVSG